MRVRTLVLFGLLAYSAALVITMPAAFVLQWVDTRPVTISGVQGTLWNGRAQQVELPDLSLSDVSWEFLPRLLVFGQLGAAIGLNYLGGNGDGQVTVDWQRQLHVRSFNYQLAAERLVELLPLPLAEFAGRIDARIQQVTIGDGRVQQVAGEVDWKRATLRAPFEALLGDYRIDLKTTERGHQAMLKGSGGTLDAEGALRLQPDGRYTADLKLRPRSGAPRELREHLDFMARRQGDGSYQLRQRGSLDDFL